MSDIAMRVENLGKRYRIGARQKRANTMRERLGNLATSPFDYLRSTLRGPSEEEIIWALKDVSFEVKPGEVVGIIGRNGAGKTTLLKILSRITEPTEGRAEINGRVGSLLEVGTGFHPELTGRENIYLNGAILGMKRAEIERKFDEIVDFSGVETFIDTPVKRYSSGMYVRLAFAVAAHLEPEILLVDEVLAVGDVAFQKKCLGKMGDVAREGRTVLFVSHNMGAIQNLTRRCLLLNDGKLILDDNPVSTIEKYLESSFSASSASGSFETGIAGFFLESIELDEEKLEYGFNKPLKFDLHLKTEKEISDLVIGLQVINSVGARIMTPRVVIPRLNPGDSVVSMILENHYLPPGRYILNIGMNFLGAATGFFYKTNALSFEIADIGIDDSFLTSRGDKLGVCLPVKYHIQEIKRHKTHNH